jgi:hypothetical protein
MERIFDVFVTLLILATVAVLMPVEALASLFRRKKAPPPRLGLYDLLAGQMRERQRQELRKRRSGEECM